MGALAERGHEVAYFLSGRHYPFIAGPRLKAWRRGPVAMHEVINPPVLAGMEYGTRFPERELSEPRTEAAFARVLRDVRPDVVHIQDLSGLPSSVIEVAAAAEVPTVMTLHDYLPLCSTMRLFDSDGRICLRREVGADCVARNAKASPDARPLIRETLAFEIGRARRLLRLDARFDPFFEGRLVQAALARAVTHDRPPEPVERVTPAADPGLAPGFQRRRDTNVERLGHVDRLIAQSPRLAEIYTTLGVSGERMSTLRSIPAHIERLHPRALRAPPSPITFATLNGCASPSKGSEIVLAALRTLRAHGHEGRFRFRVMGHVDDAARDELLDHQGVAIHGEYERAELNDLLDDVDVGILPSVWEEALGYTGLELLAKGVPLIANPLGGIVEYAREGDTAWLNHSCSGAGLAELMSGLIADPAAVVEMHTRVLAARAGIVTPLAQHVAAIEDVYETVAKVA